jgi:hypothetical protein
VIAFRVVDTATFIEAGRKVNGDFYDYSESVFSGYKNPIFIRCNRCGKRVALKNAASHYLKGCGCQACNRERLSPCKICGVNMSSKIYHKQGKRCDACREREKQNRLAHKEAKHGKHCKKCGVWFVDRDRFYCSGECRKSIVAKPVVFNCSHCGIDSIRNPHRISNLNRMFCSRSCQDAFQRIRWDDYQTKGKRDHRVVSFVKTKKAKSKWINQRRLERRKNSEGAKWWSRCKTQTKKLEVIAKVSDWGRRCNSAASFLKSRREPTFKTEKHAIHSWGKTIIRNRRRLQIDLRTKEEIQWSKKIKTAVRGCKRRFLAKNKNAIGYCGTSTKVAPPGLLMFAE